MTEVLVIGLGGLGGRIAHELRRRWRSDTGRREILVVDTMDGAPVDAHSLQRDEFVDIGGFTLSEAIATLDLSGWDGDDVAVLRSRNDSIRSGAAALPVIGKAAFQLHQRRVFESISRKLASFEGRPTRVLVVGSIAGGTGGGVAPDLFREIRRLAPERGIVELAAFFLGADAFRSITPRGTYGRVQVDNETWALDRLGRLGMRDPWRGGAAFLVRSPGGSPDVAADYLAAELAKHWVDANEKRRRALVETADEGILVLGLNAGERIQPTLLWTQSLHAADLDSPLLLPPSAVRMVPVETAGTRWEDVLQEFEQLINHPDVPEARLQKFLERYPEILQGVEYDRAEPHVYLSDARDGVSIPDFMMVPIDSELADIIELKRPRDPILTQHGRRHPAASAVVTRAVSQALDYHDYFENPERRERIQARYGFTAYRPKVTVVVGLLGIERPELDFRRVLSRHPSVEILPYDRLLRRARRALLRV